MAIQNLTRLLNRQFWADRTFRHESVVCQKFSMTSLETLDTKNSVNKLRYLLVTYMTYFDTRFGHYRRLKSGYSADQILDRLDIQVIDQVFGPQEVQNLLEFEHRFCR
jgi:hypothetical protein